MDKKELLEKTADLISYWERFDGSDDGFKRGTKNGLNILRKIIENELEEPETLSQEWIDNNAEIYDNRDNFFVSGDKLKNTVISKKQTPKDTQKQDILGELSKIHLVAEKGVSNYFYRVEATYTTLRIISISLEDMMLRLQED